MTTKFVTATEMKALDAATINGHGVPSLVLTERAALASVRVLRDELFDLSSVVVVCGPGNNGGDGVAVARLLHLAGVRVSCALVDGKRSDETCRQLSIARSYAVPVDALSEVAQLVATNPPTTVVDALLGIGGDRAPAGDFLTAVRFMNDARRAGAKTLAIDMPSGVSADSGAAPGEATQADVTVTFAYEKVGLTLPPGSALAGTVVVMDIGIYDSYTAQNR